VFDPQALNEAFWSGPRPLLEEPLEVKRAQIRACRDIAQRRLVSIVCLDEVDAGFDALEVECIHGLDSMWTPSACHPILAARECQVRRGEVRGLDELIGAGQANIPKPRLRGDSLQPGRFPGKFESTVCDCAGGHHSAVTFASSMSTL
jgi:hypothetical protein